ncbi:MAG: cysteine--tRNA ligase [Spirochaetaceae bacterium]|jgi:cysteinyl-tRNA synthetase|nr:cysteine--tRNA ligase [Spirochaetaceae bacterium]
MSLSIFNTMGRKIEPFIPLNPKNVGFYGCGPTVYNYAHIGNLRAYVTHDILVRTLRRAGFKVTHVMNVTDVGHLTGDDDSGDDKMLKSAEERGKSVLEVAAFYTNAFFNDTALLNINKPDVVCKATEHIPDMIALIKKIEAAGFTYQAGGNLYYDISKFPHYGELAHLRLDELKAGARTGIDGNKRNAGDFVLWFTKSKFENQALVWDSPWGRGYPGWHIECSAMSIKYLGEQFDIHAGGIDHIQIHHTNEIAQSEAACAKHPWVRYWVHNEFLVLDKGKMSKSHGGFITLQNLIDQGFSPLDLRYFLLGGHYRSQLQFSNDSLAGAQNARKSLLFSLKALARKVEPSVLTDILASSGENLPQNSKSAEYITVFNAALDDDLNTPRALSSLWTLIKDNSIEADDILRAVISMDGVLGLKIAESLQENPDSEINEALKAEVEKLISERADAKKAKNFAQADAIRNALKERGIILEDFPGGTKWRKE